MHRKDDIIAVFEEQERIISGRHEPVGTNFGGPDKRFVVRARACKIRITPCQDTDHGTSLALAGIVHSKEVTVDSATYEEWRNPDSDVCWFEFAMQDSFDLTSLADRIERSRADYLVL